MNRRRFLKYAGATVAVVGASALSLNYYFGKSPSTIIPTKSTTLTQELATPSTSISRSSMSSSSSTETIQPVSLRGRLFFDYNGNGKQDTKEPPVAGAPVQLYDSAGKVIAETCTDSSGDYKLEDVRGGTCRVQVGVDHLRDKKFRYMCT